MPTLTRADDAVFEKRVIFASRNQLKFSFNMYFAESEPQVDPVLVGIRTTILELQSENMNHASVEITIDNLTLSPPIWPVNKKNENIDVKMYVFRMSGAKYLEVHPVCIADRKTKGLLSPDRILVRDDGKWSPLKAWLLQRMKHGRLNISDLVAQQKWWKKMNMAKGKIFPFRRLPKELRLQVLRHALGSDIRPEDKYFKGDRHVIFGSVKLFRSDIRHERLATADTPNYAVFRVNKQFQEEAMEAGWIGTPKHFINEAILELVVKCANPPPFSNWLSKIYLDFTMKSYFSLFGVFVTPSVNFQPRSCTGEVLRQIDTLEEITFKFGSPYEDRDSHYAEIDNPWRGLSYSDYIDHSDQNIRRYACWKTLVDWVLVFAFPHIKHVPKVHLHGCVKTALKDKWTHILNVEYQNTKKPVEQKRDCGFDWEETVKAIQSIPATTVNL